MHAKIHLGIVLTTLFPILTQAQIPLPQVSPAARVEQTVGTTTIAVNYHRPAVKGRDIWGALVPYGEVWRTGANNATNVVFSDPVTVAGHPVPAGTYAFYAIPQTERFTLILSRDHQRWGAFGYDDKQDVLRFDVSPEEISYTEWLTYSIVPLGPEAAEVRLEWAKRRVSFIVEVDVDAVVKAQVEAAAAQAADGDWETFLAAASYFHEKKLDRARTREWADRAVAAREHFWTLELRARLALEDGETERAVTLLERALELAREDKAPEGYQRGLEKTLGEWKR